MNRILFAASFGGPPHTGGPGQTAPVAPPCRRHCLQPTTFFSAGAKNTVWERDFFVVSQYGNRTMGVGQSPRWVEIVTRTLRLSWGSLALVRIMRGELNLLMIHYICHELARTFVRYLCPCVVSQATGRRLHATFFEEVSLASHTLRRERKGLVMLQPSSCPHSRNLMWPIRSVLFVAHIRCCGVQLRHNVFSRCQYLIT